MDDGLFVQMVEGTQNFTHTRSSLFLRQLPFVVDDCLQFATGCAKEKKSKFIKLATYKNCPKHIQFQDQCRLGARLVDRMQPDNVLRASAQHQHGDLVVDLLGAALAAAAPPQELGRIVDAGLLVDRSPHRAVLSSGEWKMRKKIIRRLD